MSSEPESLARRRLRRAILTFFAVAVTFGGCMFCYKLFSFMKTIKKDELAGFAYDPILIYGFVAAGFLFLLTWAFLTGQLRDVEGIKHEMMDRFDAQERAERRFENQARTSYATSGESRP